MDTWLCTPAGLHRLGVRCSRACGAFSGLVPGNRRPALARRADKCYNNIFEQRKPAT
jgi:hypothetical protein